QELALLLGARLIPQTGPYPALTFVTKETHTGGHHWQITDGYFLTEWWPSSAKLVIGKKWHNGIHCHDYKQMLKTVRMAFSNMNFAVAVLQHLARAHAIEKVW